MLLISTIKTAFGSLLLHSKPPRFSLFLCGALFAMMVFPIAVMAQPEGRASANAPDYEKLLPELSAQERVDFVQTFKAYNSRRPLSFEYGDLRDSFAINVMCPNGYVRKADYRFSSDTVNVISDTGTDCNGGQCLGWYVEGVAADPEEVFSFTLRLQCTAEDTFILRIPTGLQTELQVAIPQGGEEQ